MGEEKRIYIEGFIKKDNITNIKQYLQKYKVYVIYDGIVYSYVN